MSRDVPEDQWEALLERLCLDNLSETEWEALAAQIAEDEHACRRYVETVHLREGLPYLLGGRGAAGEAGRPAAGALESSAAGAAASDLAGPHARFDAERRPAGAAQDAGGERGISKSMGVARRRSWLPTWAQAACVAFALGATLTASTLRWVNPGAFGERPRMAPVTSVANARSRSSFSADDQLGTITALSPDASAHGLLRSMQVGQELRCGEVVQLSAGFIRVQLPSKLDFLLEGPAEFSLVGPRSIFVRNGRLAATGAQDFQLQTPLLTAECRRAAVSFEVTDNQRASVYADAGTVILYSTPQEGAASEKIRVLRRGEGLLATGNGEPGAIEVMARPPLADVVKRWEHVDQRLSPYERSVLADRPAAYWPLNHVRRNRRVLDLTQHGHDGLPIGNWPLENTAQPTSERGTYFNGQSYIEPDRKPQLDPRQGFAVEGWAKVVGGPEFQSIFTSRWVINSMKPDCQCFGFTLYAGEKDRWEFWTGTGVKGEVWQRLESDAPVDRSGWVHVTATFAPTGAPQSEFVPGRVELYVNGQSVASAEHRVSLTDFEWPARIGAAEFVPRYLTSWLFHGYLSDVAVYNHPLGGEAIRRHYEVGKLRGSESLTGGRRVSRQRSGTEGGRAI